MRNLSTFVGLAALAAVVSVSAATAASAATLVFSGQDDGAPSSGPFPNSAAAEAAFLAAAGLVVTETFETQAVGFYSPIAIVGGSIAFEAEDLGNGLSGISDTQIDPPEEGLFGFNITPGGQQWFGFPSFMPDSIATFSFDLPTNSFGFYSTGVQAEFTAAIRVVQNDGNEMTFDLPINLGGGASYFGIVDDLGFSSVSIINTSVTGQADAWGIDDVSYNAIPEPATWAMLIAGFGMVGVASRRRRSRVSIIA